MLNVKNVVGLNKALEFNEYDTTVEFMVNSDINCTYKVFCNHNDKCYKLTVKDVMKMSYKERNQLAKDNPELFKQLMGI